MLVYVMIKILTRLYSLFTETIITHDHTYENNYIKVPCANAAACVVYGIVLGKKFAFDDPELVALMEKMELMVKEATNPKFVIKNIY